MRQYWFGIKIHTNANTDNDRYHHILYQSKDYHTIPLIIQRCDWYSTSVHVLVTEGFYLAFLGTLCSIKNWDIGTKMKKFYEGYITCYIYLGTITLSVLWDDFYMTWDIILFTG